MRNLQVVDFSAWYYYTKPLVNVQNSQFEGDGAVAEVSYQKDTLGNRTDTMNLSDFDDQIDQGRNVILPKYSLTFTEHCFRGVVVAKKWINVSLQFSADRSLNYDGAFTDGYEVKGIDRRTVAIVYVAQGMQFMVPLFALKHVKYIDMYDET